MLDVQKLKDVAHKIHESEEEFIEEKKKLIMKTLHLKDRKTPKNGVIYIVLAFFLGALGFHNFYAGYWGRGLAQLILTLIAPWFLYIPLLFVAFWALLELLFVGKDSKGRSFSGSRKVIVLLRAAAVVSLVMAFSYNSLVIEEPDFAEVVVEM
ncbi:MAG: TM2 domain-containing protein [Alphaproteobacteria bacterium]|nr:TM2 domain-containing protein [Alphaproteobacteria bacterium]